MLIMNNINVIYIPYKHKRSCYAGQLSLGDSFTYIQLVSPSRRNVVCTAIDVTFILLMQQHCLVHHAHVGAHGCNVVPLIVIA